MLPFSLFLALKYLKPKRSFLSVVTVISVLGVVLGVAILVIVLSVMTGFDEMWRDKILSFKPHLSVTSITGVVEDEETVCRSLEKVPGITGAAPVVETLVLIRNGNRMRAPILLGVDADRADRVSRIGRSMAKGRFSVEGENAVIGCDLAAEMGLSVGSKFLVYSSRNVAEKDEMYLPTELTVAGIFDMGMRDYDEGMILASLEVGRELVGLERGAQVIYLMTRDPLKFDTYAEQVSEAAGPAFNVRTWREVDSLMFNALTHEKTMMFVLLVFITIVALFCVTNTLIVITVQKTNEIGLLKALGFSPGQIMGAFIWHGWIQCLVGTVAGIGAGLLILNNLRGIVRCLAAFNLEVFPKRIYGLSEIPWNTSVGEISRIAVLVMVFCTIANFLPAWRASRMDPVEALRNE